MSNKGSHLYLGFMWKNILASGKVKIKILRQLGLYYSTCGGQPNMSKVKYFVVEIILP